jgi:hypothetical protein
LIDYYYFLFVFFCLLIALHSLTLLTLLTLLTIFGKVLKEIGIIKKELKSQDINKSTEIPDVQEENSEIPYGK